MSSKRPIRKILVGILLLVVGVQIGLYFALKEKRSKEDAATVASAADLLDASATATADAGSEVAKNNGEDGPPDAAAKAAAPIDAAVVAVAPAPIEETPAERRKREKREKREEERQKRLEAEREKRIEARRLAAVEEQRKQEERRRLAEEERRKKAEAATKGSASFLVTPRGAKLAVDGTFVGKAPMREVEIPVGSHTLAASADGYVADSVKFTVRARRNKTVRIRLKRAPETTTTSTTTAAAIPKRPATPRVSGIGSASRGRGLVSSKCNACHRARGARSIGPRSRRRGSWDRFFSRGYHDRYERIGGLVSRSAMADIKAYLMENAKCDSNAAGEKCK